MFNQYIAIPTEVQAPSVKVKAAWRRLKNIPPPPPKFHEWIPKMMVFEMYFLLIRAILGIHLSFGWCYYFTIVLVNTIRVPFHLISPEHVSQMRGLYRVLFCAWVLLHAWKGPYLEYGIYAVYWYLDSRQIRHMICSGARQHQVRKVVDCCSNRGGLSWTDSQGCSLYIPWPHIYHISILSCSVVMLPYLRMQNRSDLARTRREVFLDWFLVVNP